MTAAQSLATGKAFLSKRDSVGGDLSMDAELHAR